MLFSTERAHREWTDQAPDLLGYYSSVQGLDLLGASGLLEALGERHHMRWESLTESDPDEIFNDYYLFGVLLSLFRGFAAFWDMLLQEHFSDSWCRLQDVEDSLRILRKFGRDKRITLLDAIEDQCCHLTKLYPYKWFMSIEATYEQLECSICGKDMNSQACPHIKGELYRGVLAVGIVRKVKELHAAALVPNPRDKRCVVHYPDDGPQFRLVCYLGSLIRDGRLSPFGFSRVEERRIELTPAEKKQVGRNDRCPCGSGKKYKKCCLGKQRVERDHFDLVGAEEGRVSANQLVHLTGDPLALLAGR